MARENLNVSGKTCFLSFMVKPVFHPKEANESNSMTNARCIDFHNATGVGHLVFTIASSSVHST